MVFTCIYNNKALYTPNPPPNPPTPRPDSPIPYAYSCDAFFITVQQAANCPIFFFNGPTFNMKTKQLLKFS